MKILLKAGAHANKGGMTPLMKSTFNGNIECVRMLLQGGADVNKVDEQLNTISHNCASYEYMELLLQADIKINKKNQFGRNALEHYIVKTGTSKEDMYVVICCWRKHRWQHSCGFTTSSSRISFAWRSQTSVQGMYQETSAEAGPTHTSVLQGTEARPSSCSELLFTL